MAGNRNYGGKGGKGTANIAVKGTGNGKYGGKGRREWQIWRERGQGTANRAGKRAGNGKYGWKANKSWKHKIGMFLCCNTIKFQV